MSALQWCKQAVFLLAVLHRCEVHMHVIYALRLNTLRHSLAVSYSVGHTHMQISIKRIIHVFICWLLCSCTHAPIQLCHDLVLDWHLQIAKDLVEPASGLMGNISLAQVLIDWGGSKRTLPVLQQGQVAAECRSLLLGCPIATQDKYKLAAHMILVSDLALADQFGKVRPANLPFASITCHEWAPVLRNCLDRCDVLPS